MLGPHNDVAISCEVTTERSEGAASAGCIALLACAAKEGNSPDPAPHSAVVRVTDALALGRVSPLRDARPSNCAQLAIFRRAAPKRV